MFCQHVSTGKFRSVAHQLGKNILPFLADKRYVAQVDDELPTLKAFGGIVQYTFNVACPRGGKLPFENQSPLIVRFNNRDLEHCFERPTR
jgi:hypothetical protein